MVHGAIATSAARRARTTSAAAMPPPQREPAQWRASALHTQAISRSEGQGCHMGARPCTEEGRLFLSCSVLSWCVGRIPAARRDACVQQARVLRLLPRDSQRSGAQVSYTRIPPPEVRARAGTWQHGQAPKKGSFSLVQCPSMVHGPIAASAVRRAHATSARAAPPPQREPAQWRASALHAQATSRSEGQGWHVGARPCTEEGRLLARAVPFHGAWSDYRQRGATRVCNKRGCCASFPEIASSVARKCATRASHPPKCKPELTRKSTASHRRRAASRSCSALPWCTEQLLPARRGVHAQQARLLCLLPKESQRSGAQARCTRNVSHEVRARAGTWEHGLAPKKGGFSLVQCPFMVNGANTGSAARRARATSARAAPPSQR